MLQALLGDTYDLLVSDVPPSSPSLGPQRLDILHNSVLMPKPYFMLFELPFFVAPGALFHFAFPFLIVPAVDASVGAESELQHGDLQLVLYVQCDHSEVH